MRVEFTRDQYIAGTSFILGKRTRNHWFYRDFTKVYQIAQWHHHEMPELLINKPIELRYSPRPEQNHNPIATYDRTGQNEEKSAVFVSTTFIEIQTLRDCVLIAC